MRANSSESERFMRRAIQLSRRGFPAPNPHVGCVIVSKGEIVGEGYHDYAGGPHAEVVALQQAGDKALGADVYVTLAPCNHRGRTGPCASALIMAGVKRVFIARPDPNPKARGGVERLVGSRVEVQMGILADEAAKANLRFIKAHELQRPYIVLKAAISLDGRIALPSGESKWITGEAARREAHRLRAQMGAVLVGSGTVLADDPMLTARIKGVKNQPLRIVLDVDGSLNRRKKVLRGEAGTLHVVARGKGSGSSLELPAPGGEFDLRQLMEHLWKRGVTGLLVEGGATTISSFIKQRLADRIELFMAPKLFGAGSSWLCDYGLSELADAVELGDTRISPIGKDLRISGEPVWKDGSNR